jgi:hypothetical protein
VLTQVTYITCDKRKGGKLCCGKRVDLAPAEIQPYLKIIDMGWRVSYQAYTRNGLKITRVLTYCPKCAVELEKRTIEKLNERGGVK